MEEINCIFCGMRNDQIAVLENNYKGRKCPKCELVYVSPRPNIDEVLNMYSENQGLTSADMHLSAGFAKKMHARQNVRIIRKHIRCGSILEIGVGGGHFLNEAKNKGYEVYGIEPNGYVVDHIAKEYNIPCEVGTLNENTFYGKSFDVIYHCNVLSHLFNPIEEFKIINRRLNENGLLVFETGNNGEIEEKYYDYFSDLGFPDHLFLFGEKSIQKLLDNTGFECIKMYKYSIMIALLAEKYKTRIKKTLGLGKKQKAQQDAVKITDSSNSERHRISCQKLVKDTFRVIYFVLKYKIGLLLPKKRKPQQIVVIAKKR